MNNLIGLVLGITDDSNPEWKYINHEGHVVTCTKKQFQSYFKNRKLDHKEVMKRAVDALFAPNPWFREMTKKYRYIYGASINNVGIIQEKEVRKKMAIDYKEEWEKFAVYYKFRKVEAEEVGAGATVGKLMKDWISDTIESREKLMQEYVRGGVETEIVGGEAAYHTVKLIVRGHTRGCISISKDVFRNWLKKRMKGGKESGKV